MRTSNSSIPRRAVGNLEAAVRSQHKRKFLNTETYLRDFLGEQDFAELSELLRSDNYQLAAIQRVLKERGADVNYASLHRMRDKLRAAQ